MSRLDFVSIVFFLSLFSVVLQAQTPEKPGTATVSGRVTLKGAPARDVTVALQSSDQANSGDRNPGVRMKTGEDGGFKFTGVKAGRYVLGALAPGFVTPTDNYYGPQGKAINLKDGETIEDFAIPLGIGAVITGRVTDANDRPLVDERVELSRIDERGKALSLAFSAQSFMYTTDDRGVYRLFGLPAGRYLVSAGFATREGTIMFSTKRTYYPRTFHPDVVELSEAKIITLGEGEVVGDVDIKLPEAKQSYEVAGRVETPEGGPAVGVRIAYGTFIEDGKQIGAYGSMGNTTDSKGEFQIPGVLPGKYAVFAQPERGAESYSEPAPFEVKDADIAGLVVKLLPGGTISGVAALEGADPSVMAKAAGIEISASVTSDKLSAPEYSVSKIEPDGGFHLTGLKPGLAQLYVRGNSELKNLSVVRIEHQGALRNEGVRIGAGERVTGVRVAVAVGTCVARGQVRFTNGQLPEDAVVFVRAFQAGTNRAAGASGQLDQRGQFVIEGLTPGEHEFKLNVYFRSESSPERTKLMEFIKTQSQKASVAIGQETRVSFEVALPKREGDQ